MCCPTSDGSAAALVVSEDFVKAHNLQVRIHKVISDPACHKTILYKFLNLQEQAVEILAMELVHFKCSKNQFCHF